MSCRFDSTEEKSERLLRWQHSKQKREGEVQVVREGEDGDDDGRRGGGPWAGGRQRGPRGREWPPGLRPCERARAVWGRPGHSSSSSRCPHSALDKQTTLSGPQVEGKGGGRRGGEGAVLSRILRASSLSLQYTPAVRPYWQSSMRATASSSPLTVCTQSKYTRYSTAKAHGGEAEQVPPGCPLLAQRTPPASRPWCGPLL